MTWQLLSKPRGLTEQAQQLLHGSHRQENGVRVIVRGEVLLLHTHIQRDGHFTEQIAHFNDCWQIVLADQEGRIVPESIPFV